MPLSIRKFIKGLGVQNETDRTKQLDLTVNDSATTQTTTTVESIQTVDRTLTLPDATDTLVGKVTTDVFENKTIGDNNIINAQTDAFVIQDATDQTKQVDFNNSSATTSTKTTIASQQTQNRQLLLPDADDQLVARATTDTLTNKTIDGTNATGTNVVLNDAEDVTYDNSTSGLTATDAQAAIDEVEGRLDTVETNKLDGPGTHADNLLLKTDGVNSNDTQTTGISVDDLNNVTGVNDLTVSGNLTVEGTTTTLNTATLDVEDTNITVNNGGNDVSAEGAGLTVERTGTDGSLVYEDALTSKFKIGALGSEIEIADVSSSQVLSNKDLSDPSNNVDTASADSLTRASGNQSLISIPDATSADDFVLEDHAQIITNKDIDGGTASNSNRITLPKNTTTNLNGLTRKQGTVVYDTTTNELKYDTGATLIAVGAPGSIDNLTDVDTSTTSPSTGDTLEWDGSNWVPQSQIRARYTSSSGQSIPASTVTIVDFATSDEDTASAVTTGASWNFTCPAGEGGRYLVSAYIQYQAFSALATVSISLHKNGAQIANGKNSISFTTAANWDAFIYDTVDLAPGDTIDVRAFQNSGAARSLNTILGNNYINIRKIGN